MTDAEFDQLLASFKRKDTAHVPQTITAEQTRSQIPYAPTPVLTHSIPTPKHIMEPIRPTLPIHTSNVSIGTPRFAHGTNMQRSNTFALQHMAHNMMSKINHIFENGQRQTLDQLLQGHQKDTWRQAISNELGRLSQGVNSIQGNDVIEFISNGQVPPNKKVTYANMVCDYRPLKTEKYRVRLTVGGDRLEYHSDAASLAASLLESKLLFNNMIFQLLSSMQ